MPDPQNPESVAAASPECAHKSDFEHVCEPGYPNPCEPLPICESAEEFSPEPEDGPGVVPVERPNFEYASAPAVPPEPEPPTARRAELPTFGPVPYAPGFYQQQTAMAAISIARKLNQCCMPVCNVHDQRTASTDESVEEMRFYLARAQERAAQAERTAHERVAAAQRAADERIAEMRAELARAEESAQKTRKARTQKTRRQGKRRR
jgi:hypothetical protein